MLVRSLRDHYHDFYRKEGEEFEFAGPLYENIEAVKPAESEKPEKASAAHDKNDKKT